MINPPVSLAPLYAFVTIAVFCFAAWGGIIPLPGWMQTLGLYAGMAAFVFSCLCALDWMVDRATRYANIDDLLDPQARMAEAVSKMTHEQLELMYNVFGFAPEPDTSADYVTLDDGTAVDRQAIMAISRNANGIDLRPEREYTANQAAVRYTHDALSQAGVIEPARGRRGPRIRDIEKWEKVITMAKGTK